MNLFDIAIRISGIETIGKILKKKGKWCVVSGNPDSSWSGGCFDTKAEAEKRLRQVEYFKHNKK